MGSCVQCNKYRWQLRPDRRKLARLVVFVAEADQGVCTSDRDVPKLIGGEASGSETSSSMDTPTSVKHAHRWQQPCTTRRFLTTADAEIAFASSWRKTMIRDLVSECRHEKFQRLESRVQKLERRWMLVNRRFVWMHHQSNQLPRIKRVVLQVQVQVREQMT